MKHKHLIDFKARSHIEARFPKSAYHRGTVDPFTKAQSMAGAGGGPTGRSDDNFGAKAVRAAYDKVKAK